MLPELKQAIMGMGSPGFEVSTQEETAMRLKPNKMFKRVTLWLRLSDIHDLHLQCLALFFGVPRNRF